MCSLVYRLCILSLLYLGGENGFCSGAIIEFEQIQHYSTLNGITPLVTTTAISAVHCAILCEGEPACLSFTCDCALLTFSQTSGECNLYGSYVTSPFFLGGSHLCYVQKKIVGVDWDSPTTSVAPPWTTTTTASPTPTTTTTTAATPTTTTASPTTTTTTTTTATTPTTTTVPPTTTSTPTTTTLPPTTTSITTTTTGPAVTTTSLAGTIRGLVEGDFRQCSGSSGRDFILLTDSGVYVYEDLASMASGYCSGPTPLATMFPDYTDLPAISNVECVLHYQSDVEMYAAGYVYIWQNSGSAFNKVIASRKTYLNHLGSSANTMIGSKKIRWCALRQKNNVERHFNLDDGSFVLVDSQAGTYSYDQTTEIRHNNFNMNPWGDIPADVIAACGYTSQSNIYFALIDSSLILYSYYLNHSPDNNNPTKTATPQDTLSV